jgi:hypothetical protein
MKTLILAGHFDLCEKINKAQKESIRDAKAINGDLAILVGDIGVPAKIMRYIEDGIEGAKDIYRQRIEKPSSRCVHLCLPKETEINKVVDEAQLKKSVNMLFSINPKIVKAIKTKTANEAIDCKFMEIVRNRIVPELINDRLEDYGLNKSKVRIYSERKLRNLVIKRTRIDKKTSRKSWRQLNNFLESGKEIYLGPMRIVNAMGIPICRGIMLALYESIASEGYGKIIQLNSEKFRTSSTKAQVLYEIIAKQLPLTKEKKVVFGYKWYS